MLSYKHPKSDSILFNSTLLDTFSTCEYSAFKYNCQLSIHSNAMLVYISFISLLHTPCSLRLRPTDFFPLTAVGKEMKQIYLSSFFLKVTSKRYLKLSLQQDI